LQIKIAYRQVNDASQPSEASSFLNNNLLLINLQEKVSMKLIHTMFLVLFGVVTLNAQVPNGGFENWTNEFMPDGWYSNTFPGVWTTVEKTTEAHEGSLAARMQVIDFMGTPILPVLGTLFQVDQVYQTLSGYYRFHPVTNNEVLMVTAFYFSDGALLSSGFLIIEEAAEVYTPFSFNIEEIGAGSADSVMIQFELLSNDNTDPGVGSFAYIDYISFGEPTGINDNEVPFSYSLRQNYPNPFNPTTTIEFSVARDSYVDIKVFNALGREVASPVKDNYPAGNYKVNFSGSNLPSGAYFYRIQAGEFTETRKMILLK
jgi:hypothetical protein